MKEYKYTEKCKEISGFGGGYEEACRNMVIAGMKWIDKHPKCDLSYKEYKNIYGLTTDESKDMKKLQNVILKVAKGCTGAMMQATMGHIMFAHKNGWNKYIEEMEKEDKE